jgi:hypothetical protein
VSRIVSLIKEQTSDSGFRNKLLELIRDHEKGNDVESLGGGELKSFYMSTKTDCFVSTISMDEETRITTCFVSTISMDEDKYRMVWLNICIEVNVSATAIAT